MNDKILLEDILTTIKAQCDLYLHATIESSTPDVHDTFNNSLFEFLRIQNEVYTKMAERNWYPKEQVPMNKVQQVEQKFVNQVQ
jgi:spore coat protein CotF